MPVAQNGRVLQAPNKLIMFQSKKSHPLGVWSPFSAKASLTFISNSNSFVTRSFSNSNNFRSEVFLRRKTLLPKMLKLERDLATTPTLSGQGLRLHSISLRCLHLSETAHSPPLSILDELLDSSQDSLCLQHVGGHDDTAGCQTRQAPKTWSIGLSHGTLPKRWKNASVWPCTPQLARYYTVCSIISTVQKYDLCMFFK